MCTGKNWTQDDDDARTTDTQRELFLRKFQIFGYGQTKQSRKFLGHFEYFRPNYSTYLGTSPLSMVLSIRLFISTKNISFQTKKTYKSKINPKEVAMKNLQSSLQQASRLVNKRIWSIGIILTESKRQKNILENNSTLSSMCF